MKIGKIISIEYDKFRVKLFNSTRNSTVNIDGKVYYFGNIGSYLKTKNSAGEYIIGEVISIADWIGDMKSKNNAFNLDSSREIIVKPIGTILDDDFCMGIGIFPSLYSDVEIVTYNDLSKILQCHETKKLNNSKVHSSIVLGQSKSLINYEILVGINNFFNIHTAILGNSGSGKSNTIAHILQEVYKKSNYSALGSKTIIFDANGEYPRAFSEEAKLNDDLNVIFYKPSKESSLDKSESTRDNNPSEDKRKTEVKNFKMPYYLMNLDEWLSFLMASERTQKPFWDKVLQYTYKFYGMFNSSDIGSIQKFSNYIKWKLSKILLNILTQVNSDTIKMTSVKGALLKISGICLKYKEEKQNDAFDDLLNFIEYCKKNTILSYGDNQGQLSNALNIIIAKKEVKYVNMKGQEIDVRKEKCFKQIDEVEAIKIDEQKIESGKYFDYQFLKTAVELVLLEEESHGNLRIRDFTSTMLSRLDYFLYNDDCAFMKESVKESQKDYLKNTFGISRDQKDFKQLITIDLSEVGVEILELVTSVISRMIFDYRRTKYGEERHKNPVHLILDEAHRYIQKDATYIMKHNIFEKIAREGRKYSLYLIISSQRPSELSQTVLSQCGNYIVHRIQNEVDMKYIYSVLPYFSEDYMARIRQAVPGEALVFGNCVPMPLVVKIIEAYPSPDSENCDIKKEWFIPKQ